MDLFKLLQDAFEQEEKLQLDKDGLLDLYRDTQPLYNDTEGYGLRGRFKDMWGSINSQLLPPEQQMPVSADQFEIDKKERAKQLRIQQLLGLEEQGMLQPEYGPKDAERYINSNGWWM